MSAPSVGAQAPDFCLRDQFGRDVVLSELLGDKAVLLMFFPHAFSGVCTGELTGVRDRLDEFLTFDTEVVGLSCDHMFALRAFADTDGLNFPLLSDFWPHGAVTSAYGVLDPASGAPSRSSFVIGRDGVVRWSVHNPTGQARDLDEQLRQLHAATADRPTV